MYPFPALGNPRAPQWAGEGGRVKLAPLGAVLHRVFRGLASDTSQAARST